MCIDQSEHKIKEIKYRSPQKLDKNQGEMMSSLQSMYELTNQFQAVDNRIVVDYAPF